MIGELVLEHAMSNGSTAYVCFFIKRAAGNSISNDVDNIFNLLDDTGSISTNIILNNTIPSQDKCIVYNSDGNSQKKVFIFTTPIEVKADNADQIKANFIKTTDLFNKDSLNYKIIPKANIIKQQEEEIYIDCNPSGASDKDIQTYNVPINSEYSDSKNKIDFMKTTVNFFTFIIGLAFCYFMVPQLYKMTVVDKAILFHEKYAGTMVSILKRIRSADLWITFIMFLIFISLLIYGLNKDDYTYVTAAVFICIFYGLSFSILQNSKMDNEFMTLRLPGLIIAEPYIKSLDNDDPIEYFELKDFLNLAIQSIMFFFKDCIPSYIGTIFMYLIILTLTIASINNFKPWPQESMDNFTKYSLVGVFAIIPVMVCTIKLAML